MFSVLLILLYLFTALHIIRYSSRVKSSFHQLLLYGFAVCFAVQVFVTIGGGTRLIPLTGVTLPLISMGGSSLSTTILMFSLIQGIYVKEFDYKNLSKEKVRDLEEKEDEEGMIEYLGEDEYEEEYEEYEEVVDESVDEEVAAEAVEEAVEEAEAESEVTEPAEAEEEPVDPDAIVIDVDDFNFEEV